jgi:hypothetical protein
MHAARIVALSRLILIPAFILSLCLMSTGLALAQSGPVEVQILGVDYTSFPNSGFPNVCLQVAPIASDGTLLADLPPDALLVYENGEPRPVTSSSREYLGSAIAVVFDSSGSFEKAGLSPNTKRFDDAIAALDELVLSKGKWLQQDPKVDQLLLIAPTGPDSFKIASPNGTWTNEPIAIHNAAYPARNKTDTPLYKMLVEAMVRMKDLPDWERRAKFLLVFSDGVDRTSAQDVTDVINRANSLGVKVLAVKIGPEGAGKTLQRMAMETPRETVANWSYADYKGPESVAPLYQAIRSRGEQLKVCYRSRINQSSPQSIEAAVKLNDREYRSPVRIVTIPVKPPSVRIAAPADGVKIDRIASTWNQDPTTIEPFEEPVTVEVAWPDNFPRNIERVLYDVDGRTVGNLSADEAFTWNYAQLPAGTHSLRVTVRDELGLEGVSDPARAEINLVIPPSPTATPFVMPTPTPAPIIISPIVDPYIRPFIDNPVMLGVLLIAIIAAVLALYALIRLLRTPKPLETLTTTVTHAVRDATEIFRPKRGPGAAARAELVPLIDDAGTRGAPIPIRWQSTAIGRDPARAQIVFADKSVSRLHARIVEDSDHVFVLHDEGSASGTFACDEQIDVARPRTLKSGDLLEFGRVRVIFQIANAPGTETADASVGTDVTEPLVTRR